jgi:hypothetical protein
MVAVKAETGLGWMSLSEVLASLPSVEQRLEGELWRFDRKFLTLTGPEPAGYEIDLERFNTCASLLDIVMQVAKKTWATNEVLGSLVRSLDVLLDPQAVLCSCGHDKGPIDVRRVIERSLRAHLAYRRLSN